MARQITKTATTTSKTSKLAKKAGILFAAAMSVYLGQALPGTTAGAASPAARGTTATVSADQTSTSGGNSAGGVKLLDSSDPFANGASTQPATQPSASATTAPADGEETAATANSQGTSVNSTDVSVTDAGTVEIHVNDANLVEVLRMLSLQSQKNIVASKDVGGKVTANLYGVTVREALDAILKANGYAYREKGNFIYVYTSREIADIEKSERVTTTEIFRLYYTPAANAVVMIKPVLSTDGQVAVSAPPTGGLSSGSTGSAGAAHATEDMMVITDYPENLEKVRKVIREIDRRPQQILIEATILRAALNEDNALGVDFNVVGGVDFSSITHSNGQITNANIGNTANIHDGASSVGSGSNFAGTVPNAFRVGYVTNNVSVFLSALEAVTDTTVLANPKVLALNKQQGEVIVGRKDGYITTTVTETTQTQAVEFLDTGTRLIFRPYIGDDGYIRMEIHPEDSSGGLSGANLPFKTTTEVTSQIMIKDGHTIMIGGLFRDSSNTVRNQVPVLGNLPIVGVLFRNQRDQTTREEIIILLTPHIIKDDAAYSQLSEQMLGNGERLRVGVRRGMMCTGRERMAESYYEKAVAKRNEGDRQGALWFAGAATDLNPKFIEAINLKEDLGGKVVTTADNASVRTFLRKEMLMERPGTNQPAPRSVPIDSSRDRSNGATTRPVMQSTLSASAATTDANNATTPTTQPSNSYASAGKEGRDDDSSSEPTTQPSSAVASRSEQPESSVSDADMNKPGWYREIKGFLSMFQAGKDGKDGQVAGNNGRDGTKSTAVTATPTDETGR